MNLHERWLEASARVERKSAEHDRLVALGRERKNVLERTDDLINAIVWWYRLQRALTHWRKVSWRIYQKAPDHTLSTQFAEVDRLATVLLQERATLVRKTFKELW